MYSVVTPPLSLSGIWLTQHKTAPEMTNKDGMIWSCDKESNVGITTLICRQVEEDRGDVLSLVESDDEQIFQDTVPRLPPITNGHHTTLVQIHRIPSSMTSSWYWFSVFFLNENMQSEKVSLPLFFKVTMRMQKQPRRAQSSRKKLYRQKSRQIL